ncbi:hypothetical protein MPSEU_000313700 [Mayamaea pseudoterrestris]|nr:hypothetical protein MPSEU_000313700 [Mayamaea pseudoterrestris]
MQKLFKQHVRIHLYTLTANFYLYDKPHYRKGTYRDDLLDNLRNVAIPGTGFPLSLVASNRYLAAGCLLTCYPVIALMASVHKKLTCKDVSLVKEYSIRLLAPDDWFTYWRLNCVMVGLHSYLNTDPVTKNMPVDYQMENKWTFLETGLERGVPVSPYMKTPGIVVKHRNEEGGLGIYFYKNATDGGDWIIQERLQNSEWVQSLLPPNAPLSTFRVITCSKAACNMDQVARPSDVTALSCVFRAGREGAATDHDSILFDVDTETGLIRKGTTNQHWYKLGLTEPFKCAWRSSHSYEHHPDGNIEVTGSIVPDIQGMLSLVEKSHLQLCPRVPLAGWDVVFSNDPTLPICLLETNLSCNFFRGSFDKQLYLAFLSNLLVDLQNKRITGMVDKGI